MRPAATYRVLANNPRREINVPCSLAIWYREKSNTSFMAEWLGRWPLNTIVLSLPLSHIIFFRTFFRFLFVSFEKLARNGRSRVATPSPFLAILTQSIISKHSKFKPKHRKSAIFLAPSFHWLRATNSLRSLDSLRE